MYYFIVNPNAGHGRGEKIWKKLECSLMQSGVEYEVEITGGAGDARKIAQRLTAPGRELNGQKQVIVAVGGDGTLNEILDGVSFDSQMAFGYIPTGTGNDLARSLNLPRNQEKSLDRLLNSKSYRYLDYGILSYGEEKPVYRRFAVSSGIGLDADVCHAQTIRRQKKKRLPIRTGRSSYLFLGAKALLTSKPVKGYLLLDGVKKVELNHIYFISFHIHPYEGGGFKFAPKADSSDGLLEVCVVHNACRRRLIPILWDALLGRSNHHRGVRHYSCREAVIHVERPMRVHVDGEECMEQTDLHVRCVEKKIRMIL